MKIKDIIESHGLKLDEYSKIKQLLDREPNYLELAFFQCGMSIAHKSSKVHLKTAS